jgi:small GTP-binding protein
MKSQLSSISTSLSTSIRNSLRKQSCSFAKPTTNPDIISKVIIIGDSAVGKSSMIHAIKDSMISNTQQRITIGCDFFILHFDIENTHLQMQIWDTCGQEIYRSLVISFYRNTNLTFLVYSITDRTSFESLNFWMNSLTQNSCSKIFLIGNKADDEENRKVSFEEGQQFAKEHGITYFKEISTRINKDFNCKDIFKDAAIELYDSQSETMSDELSITSISLDKTNVNKDNVNNGCFC